MRNSKNTIDRNLTEIKMPYHQRMVGQDIYVIKEEKTKNLHGKDMIRTRCVFGKVTAAPNEWEFDVEYNNGWKERVSIYDLRSAFGE